MTLDPFVFAEVLSQVLRSYLAAALPFDAAAGTAGSTALFRGAYGWERWNAVLLVLEQAFKTHDGVQQGEAGNVVELLGPKAVYLLPILVAGLQEKARSRAIIKAIGSMGPAARSAQDVLLVTLDDQDKWVVAEAAHALRRIGQLEAKVSKKLEELLEDKEWKVRKEAICALLTRGEPTSEPAREKLVSAIRGLPGRDECRDGIKMLADLPISLVRDIFLLDLSDLDARVTEAVLASLTQCVLQTAGGVFPLQNHYCFCGRECVRQTAGGVLPLFDLVECASRFNSGELALEAFGSEIKRIFNAREEKKGSESIILN